MQRYEIGTDCKESDEFLNDGELCSKCKALVEKVYVQLFEEFMDTFCDDPKALEYLNEITDGRYMEDVYRTIKQKER